MQVVAAIFITFIVLYLFWFWSGVGRSVLHEPTQKNQKR